MITENTLRIIEQYQNRPEFKKMFEKYHHTQIMHNTRAAEIIAPKVMELVKPESVIDVGCGLGSWLQVFNHLGVENIQGIEGEHLRMRDLLVDQKLIHLMDLEKPIELEEKFDLVVCLEVAEHLSEEAADDFVTSLTELGDAILFSAAIPLQGGLNHINEQWADYWQEKFEKKGFGFHDLIRPLFWDNEEVEWWYRQNMFLILKDGVYPYQKEATIRRVVHPDAFTYYRKQQVSQ
ncbi:class I SAM-dependent methyltransferase [Marivirga sp. S37H4]|uniref:Class I SAM-dependent methyltransferase n=1 Tax=Marivirga aurantiaca TaxID=2802615 RepID=A0A934WYT6_9BACT|nr:methyltransferase domain-containing protein [Marivirga aurantiaca]MBK6265320.1 class I SAM-dependent methyltransferase [Marivirga aurantiaca]